MSINPLKIVLAGSLFLCLVSRAQNTPLYSFDKSISVPGNGGYDYVFIDDITKRLFVSHGGSVNVIDLKTEKVIGSVDNMKGVHGIAIDHEVNRGFITDGGAKAVVVFDLQTFKTIKVIPVTPEGPGRNHV